MESINTLEHGQNDTTTRIFYFIAVATLDFKSTHRIHYTPHCGEINYVGIGNEFGKSTIAWFSKMLRYIF